MTGHLDCAGLDGKASKRRLLFYFKAKTSLSKEEKGGGTWADVLETYIQLNDRFFEHLQCTEPSAGLWGSVVHRPPAPWSLCPGWERDHKK